MYTATADVLLPTTVTGSWPRPRWFDKALWGRDLTTALADVEYREQLGDALSAVTSDQERAGLDIITNGDYHLDPDVGGRSWAFYPAERFGGVTGATAAAHSDDISYVQPFAAGTLLRETPGKLPTLGIDLPTGRGALEYDKIWRLTQARSSLPVKFGTASIQVAASFLTENRPSDDRRELLWEVAGAMNAELRALAAGGCKVIQIEEPHLHYVAQNAPEEVDFLVDLFNREVEGLDEVEVWIHTCWGSPNAQRVVAEHSYAASLELYLDRLEGDVLTLEMKEDNFAGLDLLEARRGNLPKKIAIGTVSHRTLQVESVEEVAADVRRAMTWIAPEDIVLSTDCGFGRQGVTRDIAFFKAAALAQGADLVRRELGGEPRAIRAADPALQVDLG